MPVLQPAEIWKKTGRYEIDELFKLDDRKGSPHVLAMTHEEAVTFHVAHEIRSYRELPMILYHLQTKERDEPRPRAGVLRTREFTMKDAYSFDRDEEGLDASYELQRQAYARILDRCGVRWYEVESDVGMMGGTDAHEYMAPCAAGENEVALAPGYAANLEVASAEPQPVELPPGARRAARGADPRPDHLRGRLGGARRAARPPMKAMPDRRRGARDRARARARRPPRQRDQAAKRPRRRASARPPPRRSPRLGPARVHRPGRRRRARDQGRRDPGRGLVCGANAPTPT